MVNFKERTTELCNQIIQTGLYDKESLILAKNTSINAQMASTYGHGASAEYESILKRYEANRDSAIADYNEALDIVNMAERNLVKQYQLNHDKPKWMTMRFELETDIRKKKRALQASAKRLKEASRFLEALIF